MPKGGIKPPTRGFSNRRSTTELLRRCLVRMPVIETGPTEWRSVAQPSSYTRVLCPRCSHKGGKDFGLWEQRGHKIGEGGRTQTCEGVSRQIYSLTPLPLGSLPRLFGCASTDLNRRRQRMRLHRGLFTYSYYRASSLIIDNLAYGARRASLLKVRVGGRGVDLNPRDAFSTPTRFRDERLQPNSATLPFGGGSVI